jgi:hypothetical protein
MPSFYFQLERGEGWLLLREKGDEGSLARVSGVGTYVVGQVAVAQVDSGG